jgi:hypothetical protein
MQHTASFYHENPGNHDLVPKRGVGMQTADGIMTFHSFRFPTDTPGVVVGSKRSGERGTLRDLRVHKPGDRCRACELDRILPVAAHAKGEECPAEKAASACIDTSVRVGHEAGVRNPPPVDEEKEREKEEKNTARQKKRKEKEEAKERRKEEKEKKKKEADEKKEQKKQEKGKSQKKAGVTKGGKNKEKRPSQRKKKVVAYRELENSNESESGSSSAEWSG